MLAGATGIDLVLLVIAADESIKPQTREHFEICRLLGIRRGVIALTKVDLGHPELVQLEIEDFVHGSFLEGAPIVPVSATTGAGLTDLRVALARVAEESIAKDAARYARLPIDRSFSIRGHGAVVTGTLVSGSIALEDELELFPEGKRVRVRGLEVHDTRVERAEAGERTAVNLGGVEWSEVQRGMMLAAPGRFRVTRQIDTMFELLSSAHPLKHRAPVHFHAGTAEVEAEARLLSGAGPRPASKRSALDPMKPGTTSPVRFLLREPLLLLPGDRFIVRMFSPVVTIGGGMVAATSAPSRLRRPALAARTVALASASAEEEVRILVEESAHGLSVADLVAKSGLTAEEVRRIGPARNEWVTNLAWVTKKFAEIQSTLAAFHQANPLQPGMTKEALRAAVLPDAPPFLLEEMLTSVVVEGEMVRLASHRIAFQRDEEVELARLEEVFARAGLAVPTLAEALAQSKLDPARARTLLQILLKNRRLIRVNLELVVHSTAAESLRAMLATRKGSRFSVGEFKEWTGVSRKYAIPLLEWLDRERVTRREGDVRAVI